MPEIGTYSLSGGRRLARQRASSDPTDLESPLACCSRKLDGTANSPEGDLFEWLQVTLLQGSLIIVGWISRKPLASGRGWSQRPAHAHRYALGFFSPPLLALLTRWYTYFCFDSLPSFDLAVTSSVIVFPSSESMERASKELPSGSSPWRRSAP